ncbi:MAG: helix-turn-helix domain-containing protein [Desulfobacterales bacterium]
MIKVEFSGQDLKNSEHDRFNHPVLRVQRRMEVFWLKKQGLSHNQISKLSVVCVNAVTKYLRIYRDGDFDEIRKVNFYRPKNESHYRTHFLTAWNDSSNYLTQIILTSI